MNWPLKKASVIWKSGDREVEHSGHGVAKERQRGVRALGWVSWLRDCNPGVLVLKAKGSNWN